MKRDNMVSDNYKIDFKNKLNLVKIINVENPNLTRM
jgi:hypothetical protein